MERIELNQFLSPEMIDITEKVFVNKEELFTFMTEMLFRGGSISSQKEFMEALYERERTGSTYMGNGLSVPHGKAACVRRPAIAFCRCKPFQYDTEEEEQARLILMLAIPEQTKQNEYVKMLAEVSMLFLDEHFLEIVSVEKNKKRILDEFYQRLRNQETE